MEYREFEYIAYTLSYNEERRELSRFLSKQSGINEVIIHAMRNFFIEEPTPYPSQEGNMDVFGDQFPSWEG